MTEEEYDIQHHKQITAKRNFDKVNFGQWQIKTWYFSPYPLSETEPDATPPAADARIPGVTRATVRSHGRTSDLLAGGLGRAHAAGEALLWVCDRCFKYMADGTSYEAHTRRCTRKHPPGEKVYQRGAHTIWEVDGAKEKLYCQNLSLFGKLFIDVKTLFFDCDNFLFYLLTDADSQRDHVLGFFSKEKMSYDGYNLACIIAFPPYQRKGYGMLMIEFSYELSRRAGRVGTPERPLSELGLRSYLTYWTSTILRYFRHILSVLPADTQRITSTSGVQDFSLTQSPAPEAEASSSTARKRRKTKGWDGEAHAISAPPPPPLHAAHALTRTLETRANPDGSATTHASVRCSLENIARATNLRIEDAAFAMSECGLLRTRTTVGGQETVVITRELVETLARDRGLKRMCMEIQHVLLP
ncbi:acyl-CoA N-acyltransferase [Peniophora sp. CONT]|nr:acyl-CoA N-acyltransferase [Peniophora sp. CONT]